MRRARRSSPAAFWARAFPRAVFFGTDSWTHVVAPVSETSRAGSPIDLLRRQPKLRHRARQVDPRWCVAIEILSPEVGTLRRVRHRGFADEGHVARPPGVPAARAHENNSGRHFSERADGWQALCDQYLDGTRDDAGARQTGFTCGQCRHHLQIVLGSQTF